MNVRLDDYQDDRNQQQYPPRRRELHQHGLEQGPSRPPNPSRPVRAAANFVPINVLGIEGVTGLGVGNNLAAELVEAAAFGHALPEVAEAVAALEPRGRWRSGCG